MYFFYTKPYFFCKYFKCNHWLHYKHIQYLCPFMQLSNMPIMWQQSKAFNHTDTSPTLKLMFLSNTRMEKITRSFFQSSTFHFEQICVHCSIWFPVLGCQESQDLVCSVFWDAFLFTMVVKSVYLSCYSIPASLNQSAHSPLTCLNNKRFQRTFTHWFCFSLWILMFIRIPGDNNSEIVWNSQISHHQQCQRSISKLVSTGCFVSYWLIAWSVRWSINVANVCTPCQAILGLLFVCFFTPLFLTLLTIYINRSP